MALFLLIIGIILIVSAVKNTYGELLTLIWGDFTGAGNFSYWIVALFVVGAVGYVAKLKPLSDGLLILILLALILTRGSPSFPGGGFFQQFTQAIGTTQSTGPNSASSTINTLLSGLFGTQVTV